MLRKILVFVFLFAFAVTNAQAAVIIVEDLPGINTEIQDAVDAADSGDTIMVMPGIYAGARIEFKSVSIVGSGNDTLVNADFCDDVICKEEGWDNMAFAILGDLASGTQISDLAIDMQNFASDPVDAPFGVIVLEAPNCILRGLKIMNTPVVGVSIKVQWSDSCEVTHNKVIGFWESGTPDDFSYGGVFVQLSNNCLVAFNDIANLLDEQAYANGLSLILANENKIVHNKIDVNTESGSPWNNAITLFRSNGNTIGFNDLRGSYYPYAEAAGTDNLFSRNLVDGENGRGVLDPPPEVPADIFNPQM